MADEIARQKLLLLASKVKGKPTTLQETEKIETALAKRKITTPQQVEEVLAEGLTKSSGEVRQILASQDDSKRLIDDIVKALGK